MIIILIAVIGLFFYQKLQTPAEPTAGEQIGEAVDEGVKAIDESVEKASKKLEELKPTENN